MKQHEVHDVLQKTYQVEKGGWHVCCSNPKLQYHLHIHCADALSLTLRCRMSGASSVAVVPGLHLDGLELSRGAVTTLVAGGPSLSARFV